MTCTFHPTAPATARCSCCHRQLCPACDHRIKGGAYCQDCIVAGIDSLRRNQAAPAMHKTAGHSPLIAALFGVIPGLGAAYNGQNIKSLLHFIIPVCLWQLGDLLGGRLELSFFLAGAAFYIFSLYDAVRAAKRAREGEDLQPEDEALKHMLRERTNILGAALAGIGLLTLLDWFLPHYVHRLWPFLLILFGLYLLREHQQRREQSGAPPHYLPAPPSAIGAPYERAEKNLVSAESRFDQWR
jgi:hypothetical protein